MLKSKSFLAVDFGAGSLKTVEFEPNEAGGLRIKQFAYKPLGPEAAQEATREAAVQKALAALLAERSFEAKNVNLCAPGFHVFSKFVKLPPADASKIAQIIQYEAQQNVPFPLEEVVWDYQILGSNTTGELEVLLVAIKTEIVEGLFRITEASGLRAQLVDVTTAALCNAFRYNYGDLEGCTMLLDIGAKTSNVLFFEKGKVFARSINIGANSITQEFANEAKLPFDQAEQFKKDYGFVSLGGAYEEPDDAQQAQISKIARQIMTRLHIQVNQTMQFYRGQQGGSAPQQVFLSGGGSILAYTAQFFNEKLNIPVEYFNPLRNVEFAPEVNLDELSAVAHTMGEVVGLGLRNLANCPVELNLMPDSFVQRQEFSRKKPFFIATVFSLVLVVFAIGFVLNRVEARRGQKLQQINDQIGPLVASEGSLERVLAELKTVTNQTAQISFWIEDRVYWGDLLEDIRQACIRAEKEIEGKEGKVSIWLHEFIPDESSIGATPTPPRGSLPGAVTVTNETVRPGGKSKAVAKGVPAVTAKFRVYPSDPGPMVQSVLSKHLVALPNIDPEGTGFESSVPDGSPNRTGTFEVKFTLKLKRLSR